MAIIAKTYTVFIIDALAANLQRFNRYFVGRKFLVYYLKSYREAHAIMVGVAPDVVICSIHSPEGEGRRFLETIQCQTPHTIRIIQSSEENRKILLQMMASGLAQRYLCFPWEKHGVEDILSRDLMTRSRIRTNRCWQYIQRGRFHPVLPSLLKEIEKILAEPDFSLDQIVNVIEQDPLVAGRLLQIVNSAAFARSGAISDLLLAVSYIGIRNLRELLLFICAMETFPFEKECLKMARLIARHSFLCSRLARTVAEELSPGSEREASTAALLHDIGKLLVLTNSCGKFAGLLESNGINGQSWLNESTEEELFGFRYTELGSCLLLTWNLPMGIVEAISGQEYPLLELCGTAQSVAIADRCLQEVAAKDAVDAVLETVAAKMPLDRWRMLARQLVST